MVVSTRARSITHDERGGSLVEYMIILGVVALAALGAYQIFGESTQGLAQREGSCVRTFQCGEGSPFPESGAPATDGAPASPGSSAPPGSAAPPSGRVVDTTYARPTANGGEAGLYSMRDGGRSARAGYVEYAANENQAKVSGGLFEGRNGAVTATVGTFAATVAPGSVTYEAIGAKVSVEGTVLGAPTSGSFSTLDASGQLQLGANGVRFELEASGAKAEGNLGALGAASGNDMRLRVTGSAGTVGGGAGVYLTDEDGDGYRELNVSAGVGVVFGAGATITIESGVVGTVLGWLGF